MADVYYPTRARPSPQKTGQNTERVRRDHSQPVKTEVSSLSGTAQSEPPPLDVAIRQLIHAVALEEAALAHLINVEAHKLNNIETSRLTPGTFGDIMDLQRSVNELMQVIVRKEEALVKKLQAITSVSMMNEDAP